MAARSLLPLALLVLLEPADAGLSLKVWDNTARAGPPKTSTVIGHPSFNFSAGAPFSADIEGTIEFNASGVYEFYCNFSLTTTAFVWIDGHMICQDNHAYVVDPKVMDNPLPIQGQDAGKATKTLPFRAHIMYNGTVPAPVCDPTTIRDITAIGCFNDTAHQCGYKAGPSLPKTNSHEAAAKACIGAGFSYGGAEDGLGAEVWCGHGVPSCPKLPESACAAGCPGNRSEHCGGGWALTALSFSCTNLPVPNVTTVDVRCVFWVSTASAILLGHALAVFHHSHPSWAHFWSGKLDVRWSPWAGNVASGPPTAIPTELLGSELPAYEQERETMQRGLARRSPSPTRPAASNCLSLARSLARSPSSESVPFV